MTPTPPWSIVYADGSANVCRFDATAGEVGFAYEPVTPARSSTGHYRGGPPRQARMHVDDPRLATLWHHVDALETDRSRHAVARNKGDGAFTITTASGTRHFLVQRPALHELETLLASFGD